MTNEDYAPDVNYGNRFPDGYYFINEKDSLNSINQEEEKQRKYCYKPYRTLKNY